MTGYEEFRQIIEFLEGRILELNKQYSLIREKF